MAFGISKEELNKWKLQVQNGEIAFLTHYWQDPRFTGLTTVTKVGCIDINKLSSWGHQYGLKKEWIHYRSHFPHFDLLGEVQRKVLVAEKLEQHLKRFKINQ